MGLFDDALKDSESLFRDELALDFEYHPKLIKYRENEQFQIASIIKPLFQKHNGRNCLIAGSPGIGKTIATKNVLLEVEQKTTDIIPIYVNCWQKDTPFKIILEICNSIGYKYTHNKSTDELTKEVSRILNKRSAVIVLDEADKIEDFQILYSLLEEIYRKSIILITNNKGFLSTLDQRIASRLTPEIIEFKPYNKEETHGILKQRAEYAFVPNVFSDEALKLISKKTYELKDIRTGLFLLKESGNIAEQLLKRKIDSEHAQKAIDKLPEFKIKSSDSLTDQENEILNLIKENPNKTTVELEDLYPNSTSYKTFLRRLKDLEKKGLLSLKTENFAEGKKTFVTYGSIKKLEEF